MLFILTLRRHDRVDHGILLQKFFDFGVREKLLNLLSSYLSGRKQRVKVGNYQWCASRVNSCAYVVFIIHQ